MSSNKETHKALAIIFSVAYYTISTVKTLGPLLLTMLPEAH